NGIDRILSYDAMCQYSVNLVERFKNNPEWADLVPIIEKMRFSIPALHVQGHQDGCMYAYSTAYMLATAHFHGETAEQYWPELNQLGPQTRQMNGGHRQDTIIKHHSNWNYKKMSKSINLLVQDLKSAEQLFAHHRDVFFVPSQNAIYKKLLTDETKPGEIQNFYRKDTAAFCINEAISIQAKQRSVRAAVKANARHELSATQKTIIDGRADVSKRIIKLRKAQLLVMPEFLKALAKLAGCDVERELLGLPSEYPDQLERARVGLAAFSSTEAGLREGQAFDAIKQVKKYAGSLPELRRDKTKNAGRGTRNTISLEGIKNVRTSLNSWIHEYNNAREAMIVLGHASGVDDFRELKEEDTYKKPTGGLRGLGDSRKPEGYLWKVGVERSAARLPAALVSAAPPIANATMDPSKEPTKKKKRATGWIWNARLGKMTDAELEQWTHEGECNRVQWFRAEAEMLRQLEVGEAKLAEIRTTIRSFDQYSVIWTSLAEQQDTADIGRIAYAKQKAWMFAQRAELGRAALRPKLADSDEDFLKFVEEEREAHRLDLEKVLERGRIKVKEALAREGEWVDSDEDSSDEGSGEEMSD
ncbi:CxC2 domain-containing protein, partial [Favolaschia claudopus]